LCEKRVNRRANVVAEILKGFLRSFRITHSTTVKPHAAEALVRQLPTEQDKLPVTSDTILRSTNDNHQTGSDPGLGWKCDQANQRICTALECERLFANGHSAIPLLQS
jgi:hypothetical protein